MSDSSPHDSSYNNTSSLRPSTRNSSTRSSRFQERRYRDQTPLMCYLGQLLSADGDDSTSSSDNSSTATEADLIPLRLHRYSTRGSSSTRTTMQPNSPSTATGPSTQSGTTVHLNSAVSQRPGSGAAVHASLAPLATPIFEVGELHIVPDPASPCLGLPRTGSESDPRSPGEESLRSLSPSWSISSPSTVASESRMSPSFPDAWNTIQMPLPCGFDHTSVMQLCNSIDALVAEEKVLGRLGSTNTPPGIQHNGRNVNTSSITATAVAEVIKSPAMKLPSEILIQVYQHLHPIDVNAARHTCRVWMNASLNRNFLRQMLRRGAWWNSFRAFAKHRRVQPKGSSASKMLSLMPLWIMSSFLSRECALSGYWSGNGFTCVNNRAIATCDHHWGHCAKPSCSNYRRSLVQCEALREVAHISFDELASGHTPMLKSTGLVFTASGCGRYLLVAEGGMIHVYRLAGHSILNLSGIICPRRVLAMSVDVSRSHLTIAALLEGRMGFMSAIRITSEEGEGVAVHTATPVPTESDTDASQNFGTGDRPGGESGDGTDIFEVRSHGETQVLTDDHTETGRRNSHINQTWNVHGPRSGVVSCASQETTVEYMALETGPRILYHKLCSDEDPPHSVAVCPGRQCVAFGCITGLEMHWVDAHSEHNMNRWFPLSDPSDYLYFLPRRDGIDAPQKLRLVSSAAHPAQRTTLALRLSTCNVNPGTPLTNTIWGSFNFGTRLPSRSDFTSDPGHYHVVPMSDGFHLLFVDPDTNMLCLGTDAAMGVARRLHRKIYFLPPLEDAIPTVYASCSNLTTGARIAVGYHDDVILFSIPSDVLDLSTKEQLPRGLSKTDMERASEWLAWWPKSETPIMHLRPPSEDEARPRDVWPLTIRGTPVGRLQGLCELAVNPNSSRFSIWAFAQSGACSVWQVHDGSPGTTLTQRNVERSGQVSEPFKTDLDGDVVMQDLSPTETRPGNAGSSISQQDSDQDLWDLNWDLLDG